MNIELGGIISMPQKSGEIGVLSPATDALLNLRTELYKDLTGCKQDLYEKTQNRDGHLGTKMGRILNWLKGTETIIELRQREIDEKTMVVEAIERGDIEIPSEFLKKAILKAACESYSGSNVIEGWKNMNGSTMAEKYLRLLEKINPKKVEELHANFKAELKNIAIGFNLQV
jgi:hypothetical protein